MARYFFDATADDLLVTDYHGREIHHKGEVRPAMMEAVHAIRVFIGDELAAKGWTLEVRLGETNRITATSFEEVEAFAAPATEAEAVSLAA